MGASPGWGLFVASAMVLGLAVAGRAIPAMIGGLVFVIALVQATPLPSVPPGPIVVVGVLAADVVAGRHGPYALMDDGSGPILIDLPDGAKGSRGQLVAAEGTSVGAPGEVAGVRHRGVVDADRFEVVSEPRSPVLLIGNAIRRRVVEQLSPLDGGRALLAGFLIGDTSGIDEMDESAMRRSGLSHYTAVSGSNVAIFLGLLFVAMGPLAIGPRRRAVVGLLGLPVFAAATGFEPSVLRASAMAALVLGGRLLGMALETWQVISAAVIGLLALDPELATETGFQLSVAATAGVVIGSRFPVPKGRIPRALAVGFGAQLAVAPLLIINFGQVPLLSPLVNLVAAPIVAVSTVLGVIGVIGLEPVANLGSALAGLVLAMARVASSWPQIAWGGLAVVVLGLVIVIKRPVTRPVAALVVSLLIAWLLAGPGPALPDPGVVVLDVGQGDAILISGGDGRFALIDGGPDQATLAENLSDYRVRHLELVVLTHDHADHASGLAGLPGRVPVGMMWVGPADEGTPKDLVIRYEGADIEVVTPSVGDVYHLGDLLMTVIGPERQYESLNDDSIVLMVEGPARSMLLTGDIETHAQNDLSDVHADVLKVPHHGGGTSERGWLEEVGADLAVISVGANDFGHPVDWVIDSLESSGAQVVRTDQVGDVAVPLG
jgi:competence protein ComEC